MPTSSCMGGSAACFSRAMMTGRSDPVGVRTVVAALSSDCRSLGLHSRLLVFPYALRCHNVPQCFTMRVNESGRHTYLPNDSYAKFRKDLTDLITTLSGICRNFSTLLFLVNPCPMGQLSMFVLVRFTVTRVNALHTVGDVIACCASVG